MKDIISANIINESILTENSDNAFQQLYEKSRFGSLLKNRRIQLSFIEAIYLSNNEKIVVYDLRNRAVSSELLMKKALKYDKEFWVRYVVFSDLRDRGYIVKTALKFGADFRVYAKGVKPGDDHAKWVVYPVHENKTLKWNDFSGKNRVAHSTRKKLLIGVVDEESSVSYWEANWVKP